jgi:hypothetical protein
MSFRRYGLNPSIWAGTGIGPVVPLAGLPVAGAPVSKINFYDRFTGRTDFSVDVNQPAVGYAQPHVTKNYRNGTFSVNISGTVENVDRVIALLDVTIGTPTKGPLSPL